MGKNKSAIIRYLYQYRMMANKSFTIVVTWNTTRLLRRKEETKSHFFSPFSLLREVVYSEKADIFFILFNLRFESDFNYKIWKGKINCIARRSRRFHFEFATYILLEMCQDDILQELHSQKKVHFVVRDSIS